MIFLDPDNEENRIVFNREWANSWPGRKQYDENFSRYNKFATFINEETQVEEVDKEIEQIANLCEKTHLD